MNLVFKTSDECAVELIAHTVMNGCCGKCDAPYSDANWLPVTAARVSFNKDADTGKDPERDLKLMKYLADHKHTSVFEHQSATFLIECPMFVRSQIHRHRTFSYNEISRRYTDDDLGFWIPDKWRGQSKSNKQGSSEDVVTHFAEPYLHREDPLAQRPRPIDTTYRTWVEGTFFIYQKMLEAGVAKELARSVLPNSTLTRFYMTGNLRNWIHFLELRLDLHAQLEVQIVARKIEAQLRELWPEAMNVLLPST